MVDRHTPRSGRATHERDIRRVRWEEALSRSLGWAKDSKDVEHGIKTEEIDRTTTVLPSGLFFLGTALLVVIADKFKSI
ncbi:hypothetical protein evm_014738 [Chilo suppressalis]|nr:hypothetical protein evm_014738 [Chilo suppressalis]